MVVVRRPSFFILSGREDLKQLDFAILHDAFAVDAAQRLLIHIEDFHLGWNRLVVGDTLRIGALDDADDLLGVLDVLLLDNLVILDDVERDVGGDDAETTDFLIGEIAVGNLDDSLSTEGDRIEVGTDGDGARMVVEVEDLNDLERHVGRDMVDDGAVLDGTDF